MLLPALTFSLLPVSHPQKRKVTPTPTREGTKLMGLTHITAAVINPADPKKRVRMEFLVDSGAIYSVVPQTVLKKLGIKPCGSKEFTLADGTKIMRRFGNALFKFQKTPGASPVIFGRKATVLCSAWSRWKRWATSSIRSAASCARCRWCWGRVSIRCRGGIHPALFVGRHMDGERLCGSASCRALFFARDGCPVRDHPPMQTITRR